MEMDAGIAVGLFRGCLVGRERTRRCVLQNRWFGLGHLGMFGRHQLLWLQLHLLATPSEPSATDGDCSG